MKMKFCLGLFTILFLTNFPAKEGAVAKRYETQNPDPKGNLFILVRNPSSSLALEENFTALEEHIEKTFEEKAGERGLELVRPESETGVTDPRKTAEKILALPPEKIHRIGGVIEIGFHPPNHNMDNKGGLSALLEVYHYPFPSLPREHIESCHYSFKFGSDSALLAIQLHQALLEKGASSGHFLSSSEIKPASSVNAYLSQELLKRYVKLGLFMDESLSEKQIKELAERIYRAICSYQENTGSCVMGLLSEKARRHAETVNTEIRVFEYIYPNKKLTKKKEEERQQQMSTPIKVLKPFSTNLYYIAGLQPMTPYSYKLIDVAKDKDDFWYELDEGAFITSSMKGVVRTVSNRFDDYKPISNLYKSPPEKAQRVQVLDYVISGASIIDGAREATRFVADVGILDDKIVEVGKINLTEVPRKFTINGKGLFLTPGFIDIHSHADWNIFEAPYAPSHIRQGITTVLGGNCSFSPLGIGSFYLEVENKGAAVNIGMLIGNRPVRQDVIGKKLGQPSYEEVYREKELVDLAMEEGAFGMSTGLIYSISEEAYTWELAEMAKQIKPYGGFYASHIRGETDEVLDAVREAIYIGEVAEVPVQISHMKVINRRNWGDMVKYLDIMKSARERGMDVTGDQYPWRASGPAAHYRLHRLLVRDAIKRETPEVVLLKDMPGKYEKYSGRPLTDLLEGEDMTPEQLIEDLDLTEDSKVYATYLCLGEEDVRLPMKEDFVMVCTDSSLVSFKTMQKEEEYKDDHPRKFRSYPEFFGKYVREQKVCSWELGVYKCTGLPAKKMKLEHRGVIKPGAFADLVLFDPEKIDAGADYRDQTRTPKGIKWVFLNGQPVLKEGVLTRNRAGKPLRAYGHRKP